VISEKLKDYVEEFETYYRRDGSTLPRDVAGACPESRDALPILLLLEDDWSWDFPKAYLGVDVLCSREEPLVAGVPYLSPADKAGLEAGDLILGVTGGERFSGWRAVFHHLALQAPGAKISLDIRRGEKVLQKTVRLGKRPKHTFTP